MYLITEQWSPWIILVFAAFDLHCNNMEHHFILSADRNTQYLDWLCIEHFHWMWHMTLWFHHLTWEKSMLEGYRRVECPVYGEEDAGYFVNNTFLVLWFRLICVFHWCAGRNTDWSTPSDSMRKLLDTSHVVSVDIIVKTVKKSLLAPCLPGLLMHWTTYYLCINFLLEMKINLLVYVW